ncbi:LysE family translocator [Vibrio parahaemolyticus]|nr:LysE family translocator [Vibrio parahaemolyticus]
MSLETWAMFFLAYLVVTLSPGPNVLLVVKNSVHYGLWSALSAVFGNLFCQLIIVGLVAIGVGEILARLPIWFTIMKCVGGFYLIYLGIKSFRQARKRSFELTKSKSISPNMSSRLLFKEAFLISASNPKTMIFFVCIPTTVFGYQSSLCRAICNNVSVNLLYCAGCSFKLRIHCSLCRKKNSAPKTSKVSWQK